MRRTGLGAIYRKPILSLAIAAHPASPSLLRGFAVDRPDLVKASDTTYILVQGGYAYLCAVIDLHSRFVLAWELSKTLDASFCLRVLNAALAAHGEPKIFNTAQGGQFTSVEFSGVLRERGINISIDGRGRCPNNVFVERL